mmetsp:Transcript_1138/g.4780  ORF Transcript_1138/g.4780 Transcript_1138/m.4780 type:complete len:238 (-) Transcript_1138:2641-3354(-)
METSSRVSSTSRRESTKSTHVAWMIPWNSFKASENFPSVVVLYASFSRSSRSGRLAVSAGGATEPGASSADQPRPSGADRLGPPATAPSRACVAKAASTKCWRSGAKSQTPSCLCRSFMALSKSPAAACSPGMEDFCVHLRAAGTPAVGATKTSETASSMPSSAPSAAGGSSRSSMSQPASEPSSASEPASFSSGARPAAASGSSSFSAFSSPPRSRSRSSPQPAPAPSRSSSAKAA